MEHVDRHGSIRSVVEQPSAAQTLRRGLGVLRLLARGQSRGLRLTDIAAGLQLPKSTVTRFIQALLDERFLLHDEASNRYRLGPEALAIGLAAESNFEFQRLAAPALRRLANETGNWVCCSLRSGSEAICVSLERGESLLPPAVLCAGDRYPLGVSSAGLAILAALPHEEAASVMDTNRDVIAARFPQFSGDRLEALVREARASGYALVRGELLPGYWAVAVPVLISPGSPIAAISVVAPEARMRPLRYLLLAERLSRLVQEILALRCSVEVLEPH